MSETIGSYGMGWLPDIPDFNDLTIQSNKISSKNKRFGQKKSVKSMIEKVGVSDPEKIRLRDASCIVSNAMATPESDGDDPYADYKVPDDLMW